MEEDLNESSVSMLPIALGVLAIAIGGAGLYFGMTANQRLSPIVDGMESSTGSAARIEKQLASFETQLEELAAQTDELNKTVGRLRVYSSQNERDAKAALSGVKANRAEMVKLVEKFNGIASGTTRAKPAVASTTPAVSTAISNAVTETSGVATSTASTPAGVYKIQSGDNFAKIASNKGLSLQALLDANPGVDPRRLQIGQEIKIPAN
ncbi:MAG: LysM peptidoglycan-binding domain-containing protein [Lentimonas sp.]